MNTVKENLMAARALIDTPEKWDNMGGSWTRAIYDATGNAKDFFAAETAMSQQRVRGVWQAAVLDRFDRAIAAQDGAE